ncbi:hypothetical protein MKW92_029847, partial [Papaver armeniacum]
MIICSESWVHSNLRLYIALSISGKYTTPRIVLSAYGLEHEEILSIAKPLLSDLPAVSHRTKP